MACLCTCRGSGDKQMISRRRQLGKLEGWLFYSLIISFILLNILLFHRMFSLFYCCFIVYVYYLNM